ncbi:MAG TPA: virulence factor [Methylomirabilota bacterium]|nr:virulence factor [Methylomirabilota bacterium]
MADLIVVSWRDIPAQVIVKSGRKSAKRELPKRFIEAIDRVAMRTGASVDDAYLADWKRSAPVPCGDDLDAAADAEAARLEAEFDTDRLKALIAAGGIATP